MGVPVYNGEAYLEEVLDSIRAQTFEDIEVIVCDNASTDRTPEIARSFVERDGRFRYHRNDENIGASRNHNRVFELARGELFQWCSADNVLQPALVERCVAVLDEHPEFILAHSRCTVLDEFKQEEREWHVDYQLQGARPSDRVHNLFVQVIGMNDPIFGVHRADALRRTKLLGSFIGADDVLLVELAIAGPFGLVSDYLIRLRTHAAAYHAIKKTKQDLKEDNDEAAWFDPINRGKAVFPHWRRLREYAAAVTRSSADPLEKARMLGFLCRVASWRRALLAGEIRDGLGLRAHGGA